MQRLETREVRNVLHNLVHERAPALNLVTFGAKYHTALTAIVAGLDSLPAALTELPLVELLQGFDAEHDAWGRAIHYLAKAVEEGPEALAALAPAVDLVRKRYLTGLAETRAPYAVEDQRGRDRLASLPADSATLDKLTAPDGRSLSAWIHDFATAGTKLGGGLSSRVDAMAVTTASPDAASVQELRADAQRTIGKLRNQIALDLENNPALPASLMADVLGYVDEISRLADTRARPAKSKEGSKPA